MRCQMSMRSRSSGEQRPLVERDAAAIAGDILRDIDRFSRIILRMPLYRYQLEPLRAIVDSVLNRHGLEFLLIFPRQSGKNEAIAHLLVYLLVVLQRRGGQVVFGAIADGLGRARRRLEERLDNVWSRGRWQREQKPQRIRLGRAAVAFLSTHPRAASRGETADHLLIIDEAQDQDASHMEAVFTPMRAAHNATAVYLGTVRQTTDFLWRKKSELEAAEAVDGIQRVFLVAPEQVVIENPTYGRFLKSQIARYGRDHPIIAAEYFLEPMDGRGGMFPTWRRTLMVGNHLRRERPQAGELYVATVDVAGRDEGATSPAARLENPARDYTVATVFTIDRNEDGSGPVYRVVDVFADQGSPHFQDTPGQARLADRLLAYLNHWGVLHTVIDASGIGQGLADWLAAKMGSGRVSRFQFAGRAVKARLASDFLALVETGRFKYWTGDEAIPLSDGWWFWQQTAACDYSLPLHGRFDRDLRWGVPPQARVDTPTGSQLIHDDRLMSAALVAEIESMYQSGKLPLGLSESRVVGATDPLQ